MLLLGCPNGNKITSQFGIRFAEVRRFLRNFNFFSQTKMIQQTGSWLHRYYQTMTFHTSHLSFRNRFLCGRRLFFKIFKILGADKKIFKSSWLKSFEKSRISRVKVFHWNLKIPLSLVCNPFGYPHDSESLKTNLVEYPEL